tara:strand:- start:660 stop:2054 length:1395 start_codon:yes stop_codon:yes gene_type:complete
VLLLRTSCKLDAYISSKGMSLDIPFLLPYNNGVMHLCKSMKIRIPLQGVPADIRAQVEAQLPLPLEVAGWKFNGYRWRKLTQINTKDDEGNTDNSVRIGGTGDNEELKVSLKGGLDPTKLTPSIFPNDNLLNGFNRFKQLGEDGYTEWIFAEYDFDTSTATEFQVDKVDYIDDFRAAANGGDGAKVITKEELIELGRKRFSSRKDKSKKAVARWVHSLDLNLSNEQVNGIAQTVSKDFARKGVIESYNRKEAQQKIKDLGLGCDLLNSKDVTRALRLWPQIMDNYINNETTFNFALFDSDAVSHEELDDRRYQTLSELSEMDKQIMQYAAKRCLTPSIIPFECLGAISQKIKGERPSENGLVKLDLKEYNKSNPTNTKSKKVLRPRFNFIQAGIPIGSVLTLIVGVVNYECIVKDEYQVEYEGETTCLSPLTQKLLEIDRPIRGQSYWKYNNRLLSDIYEDVHA